MEEEEGDYSSPARDYEIDRSRVELGDIIGEGQVRSVTLFYILQYLSDVKNCLPLQFGDVHKGVYTSESSGVIPVAVKTCKVAGDEAMTEKFLEEACKTQI